jgi:hypothetical protein
LAKIRQEAFGEDIGQNSWITTDEYDTFFSWSISPQAIMFSKSPAAPASLFISQRNISAALQDRYQEEDQNRDAERCPRQHIKCTIN